SLAKKYRHIRSNVQPVIDQIRKGYFVGDQIPKTGDHTVFKVRVSNRDIRKGKSAGYRLIYYVKTEKKVILITIYSKTEQSDITSKQIRRILKNYESRSENNTKIPLAPELNIMISPI
ncbi:MAG: type II toxin-antitoxin system RelE/ParE family toxin, partial [Desulfosarcina sp.]|nr:type II toxin-antitoxin system RelE/ParE family toxin [Desulfobacterales bacterium]